MKVLITGSRGQLGLELARAFQAMATVQACDRQSLDVCDPQSVDAVVERFRPDFILNAAAYTAVDKAEQESTSAHAVNAQAPRVLVDAAARFGAGLVHYSTDYVFDGTKRTPYLESDETNPQSVYGRSKFEGEQAVLNSTAPHLVLRTSWVFGTHGRNFLLTILRLACERDELTIVDDQSGAPTWSRAIAEATRDILLLVKNPKGLRPYSGLYHLTAAGQTTWFGFARAILEQARSMDPQPSWLQTATSGRQPKAQVRAITTAEYPTPAQRPAWSVLSNQHLKDAFGIVLADWQEQLRGAMHSSD